MAYVLGSGMNTCYTERVDRIEKIDPIKTFGKKVEKVIINLENGMLGDNGSIDFAKTKFDFELDEQSMFPHSYGWDNRWHLHDFRPLEKIKKNHFKTLILIINSICIPSDIAIGGPMCWRSSGQMCDREPYQNTENQNAEIKIPKNHNTEKS